MDQSAGISASHSASLQGRYAGALFDLAGEQAAVSRVEADLDSLGRSIAGTPDLAALIRNPQVGRDAGARAMDAVAGVLDLSPLTKQFIGVLAANRRLASLPAIIRAFAEIAAAQRGEVTAEVTSAHPLSADQIAQLGQRLKTREGKNVSIQARVDPDLLGGLIVKIGSRQIDGSIRTRLNALALAMKADPALPVGL